MPQEPYDALTTAISPHFAARVPEIVAALSPLVADTPHAGRQWVFYGSLPVGAEHADSDLDAMLIHSPAPGFAPHRRDATWDGRPVTIYVLSHRDLAADASERRFGGYFALKLFSPSCSDTLASPEDLAEPAARFLGSLTATGNTDSGPWTGDQLLARAYLAFLELYPAFASYVARLTSDPDRMEPRWSHQRAAYVGALNSAGLIERVEDGLWSYTGEPEKVDQIRDRCVARFWAVGAVCHDSDLQFPDLYFSKADARACQFEQDAAVGFLHAVAAAGAKC